MRHLVRSLQKIHYRLVQPLFRRRGQWRRLAERLLAGKPYIGPAFAADQLYPPRAAWMRRLIQLVARAEPHRPRLLEIGSWAGQSALLWADQFHQSLPDADFEITCIDAWKQYLPVEALDSPQLRKMHRCFEDDKIFHLFLHNIKHCGLGEHIRYVRGESDDVLPALAAESFDVVYVDGSHFYPQVVKDVGNAAGLVKDGGYLCGDDLDLQMNELNAGHVRTNIERDVVRFPGSLYYYHPGVALALWECFGRPISAYDGFWVVRKDGNRWMDVCLSERTSGRRPAAEEAGLACGSGAATARWH